MNKEPIGLRFFRYIVSAGILGFVAMIYWSSEVQEEKLLDVQSDLLDIKNDLSVLRNDIQKSHDLSREESRLTPSTSGSPDRRSLTDPALPNLLQEDPFYALTLPEMLGPNFKAHGFFHEATIGRPTNLHPFSNWSNVATWHEQCSASVASSQFGKYETLAPDLAVRMEKRSSSDGNSIEYWVFLRDHAYWQPLALDMFSEPIQLASFFLQRHQVTAHDFKFYYDAVMNPYVQEPGAVAQRTYLNDLEAVEVLDDLTFVVRWKTKEITGPDGQKTREAKYISTQMTGGLRPLASFVYRYFPNGKKILEDDAEPNAYRTSSLWAQNFSQHWARNIIPSCGRWVFQSMTEREIRFRRNIEFYNPLANLAEGAIEQFKETPDAVWQEFKANKLDLYVLQPEQQVELTNFLASAQYHEQATKGDSINHIDYIARTYAYVGWNEVRPFFASSKVRQALTLAIDRERIVQQYLNGLGTTINGPFSPQSPNYDKALSPWPFDPETARLFLQQEGWYDSDNDGVIDKTINGVSVPFKFALTYYVKNPTTKAIAEYISTALKELGILCSLNGVDITDLSAVFDDKNFDAVLLGWSPGSPPEDLRQLWSSAGAKEKGSSNAVGFANQEVDEIIDKLDYTFNLEERKDLYHRFGRIIHEECPYTFLYAPKAVLLYREYLQNVWIPADRQDLIPGADVAEPSSSIYWIKKHG